MPIIPTSVYDPLAYLLKLAMGIPLAVWVVYAVLVYFRGSGLSRTLVRVGDVLSVYCTAGSCLIAGVELLSPNTSYLRILFYLSLACQIWRMRPVSRPSEQGAFEPEQGGVVWVTSRTDGFVDSTDEHDEGHLFGNPEDCGICTPRASHQLRLGAGL